VGTPGAGRIQLCCISPSHTDDPTLDGDRIFAGLLFSIAVHAGRGLFTLAAEKQAA
jgi:hypothetical protein